MNIFNNNNNTHALFYCFSHIIITKSFLHFFYIVTKCSNFPLSFLRLNSLKTYLSFWCSVYCLSPAFPTLSIQTINSSDNVSTPHSSPSYIIHNITHLYIFDDCWKECSIEIPCLFIQSNIFRQLYVCINIIQELLTYDYALTDRWLYPHFHIYIYIYI